MVLRSRQQLGEDLRGTVLAAALGCTALGMAQAEADT